MNLRIKVLISELKSLKKLGVVGIKQSFEDEGAHFDDVLKMRTISAHAGVNLSVKIGGCEAITDINNCLVIGADSLVAPMIESKFALKKYIESLQSNLTPGQQQDMNFYINIESKAAYENLESILDSKFSKHLTGIVVGRSDLTKSYGLSKKDVNYSKKIENIVEDIFVKAKEKKMNTLMGGSVGSASVDFIKKMVKNDLLDFVETRNVIIDLKKVNTKELNNLVKAALIFESEWLKFKADFYYQISSPLLARSKSILDRIS
jgi:4-hydroxy-2-oxoheptanedioate aldolase